MDQLTLFGLLAVTAMLIFYALEDRSPAMTRKSCMRPSLMMGWCGTRRSNASLLELHRAAPITSAKRLSPRGPLGMPNPYKGGAEEKPA